MGANVVGGVVQSIAASQAQKEMFKAFNQEIARQQKYQGQAIGQFDSNLLNLSAETAQQQMAQGQQQREQGYQDVYNRPLNVSEAGPTASRDKAVYDSQAQARARVGAYSDWQLDQKINDIRNSQALNQISNFAKGTASVFPYRMYQAQHSWDELAAWGQLVSSVGGGQPWTGSGQPPQRAQSNAGVDYTAPSGWDGSQFNGGSMFA